MRRPFIIAVTDEERLTELHSFENAAGMFAFLNFLVEYESGVPWELREPPAITSHKQVLSTPRGLGRYCPPKSVTPMDEYTEQQVRHWQIMGGGTSHE